MKKKLWILSLILLILILIVPIPTGIYKDGGTREYTALTYKIVKWNRLGGDYIYDKTRFYPFPKNFKSIDGLWYQEEEEVEHSFVATVLEINGKSVVVEPVPGGASPLSGKISFSTASLEKIDLQVGSTVKVIYKGSVMESYPAQIHATKWELFRDS